jgi:type VI secretion system secreted protein Hcp
MATGDMFLKLDSARSGKVLGESSDELHLNEIDILGWSWGMTTSGAMAGSGAGAKSALSAITFNKLVDSATAPLMSVMRNHDLIKEATLTVRKAGGDQLEFLVITIRQGRIVSYKIAAPAGPVVSEEFSIAFEKIDVEYKAQAQNGGAKGGTFVFSGEARSS